MTPFSSSLVALVLSTLKQRPSPRLPFIEPAFTAAHERDLGLCLALSWRF